MWPQRDREANQAVDAAKRHAGQARSALEAVNAELRAADDQLARIAHRPSEKRDSLCSGIRENSDPNPRPRPDFSRSQLRAGAQSGLAELDRRQMRLPSEMLVAVEKAQAALATASLTTATFLTADTAIQAVLPVAPYGWLERGIAPALGQALLNADRDYQRHLQGLTVLRQFAE